MSELSSYSLKSNEIVSVVGNMLKLVFFDNTRDKAKRAFRDLEEGKRLKLPSLSLPDDSQTELVLVMDINHRGGKQAFSSFKQHLGALLTRVSKTMMEEEKVPVLASSDGKQRIVNLPIAHNVGDVTNVMAVGFEVQPARIELKILYLDPRQFSAGQSAA